MTPHDIAAHRIADALRTIAMELTNASEDVWRAYCPGSERIKPEYVEMLVTKAEAIEATAPFTPLTDDEKQQLFEWAQEELADESVRDRARVYLDVPEWQLKADMDDRIEETWGPDPLGDWHGRNE